MQSLDAILLSRRRWPRDHDQRLMTGGTRREKRLDIGRNMMESEG